MSSPFTLTIDWLAFTCLLAPSQDTMEMTQGNWTKSDTGFRGYPDSWITAVQAVEWANSEPGPPVLLSKYMWICPVALSLPGQSGRSVRCSNGS